MIQSVLRCDANWCIDQKPFAISWSSINLIGIGSEQETASWRLLELQGGFSPAAGVTTGVRLRLGLGFYGGTFNITTNDIQMTAVLGAPRGVPAVLGPGAPGPVMGPARVAPAPPWPRPAKVRI